MARSTTSVVTGLASVALATALATPATAQDAEPTDLTADEPPAPAPGPDPTVPAPDPPTPPVRSGYAVDVPGAPSTELPVVGDAGVPAGPPGESPALQPGEAPAPGPDAPRSGSPTDVAPADRRTERAGTSGTPRGASHDAERAAAPPRAPRTSSTSVTVGTPPPTAGGPTEHVVVAGEHLWSIAAARVATATGRAPADVPAVEVAPYWTQLCMLNEGRLVSGDLDLVHPGEVLVLPPT